MIYKFWGKVKKHNQRGKSLGFPTANVSLHKKIPEGIYISKTSLNRTKYKQSLKKLRFFKSITFIGTVKTFNEKLFHSESYILDFSKSIYNKWISVELLKKIRPSKKFKNADLLITQMKKDELYTREYFKNFPIDEA